MTTFNARSELDVQSGLLERIVEAAPPLELSGSTLNQMVSWSAQSGLVSLGDYIGVKMPDLAHKLSLETKPDVSAPEAEQLSDEDLKKVVSARLDQNPDKEVKLAVVGQGPYSLDELKAQIEQGTSLGQRLLAAERRNIALLERLVAAGKIQAKTDQSTVKMPAFEF